MNKFHFNKRNKWIIITGILLILLIILFGNGKDSNDKNQSTEIANLKAQLDSLQKQLESEKQQSTESSSSSTANEEEKSKEESPQNSNENKE